MNDKKKKNGKPHPFEEHLRDSEKILWMSGPPKLSLWEELKISGFFIFFGLWLIMAFFVGLVTLQGYTPHRESLESAFRLLILITLPLVFVFRWLELRQRSEMPERAYAVTNERLLYRLKNNISTIRLEKLEELSVSPGEVGSTLQFGTDFPRWIEVRDADSVKALIEKTRQQRVQEIAQEQDREEEERQTASLHRHAQGK
jgi:hypothetical protein